MSVFRSSFCSAHTGMYVFDPLGDIYSCWDLTGDTRIRVGVISDAGRAIMNTGGTPRRSLLPIASRAPADVDVWQQRTFLANKACSQCRYAFYCGGGCAALALETRDDFNANYCDGLQRSFKDSLVRAYQLRMPPTDHRAAEPVSNVASGSTAL